MIKIGLTNKIMFILLAIYLGGWTYAMYAPKSASPSDLKNQYFIVYNALTTASKAMQRDEFDLDINSYTNKNEFVRNFKRYFKIKDFCDSEDKSLCLKEGDTVYTTLVGDPSFLSFDSLNAGQFVLEHNSLVMMHDTPDNLWIYTDLNGIQYPPNRLGVDVFVYMLNKTSQELHVVGDPSTPYQDLSKYCNPYVTGLKFNGFSCAYAAALKSDYFDDTFKTLKLK